MSHCWITIFLLFLIAIFGERIKYDWCSESTAPWGRWVPNASRCGLLAKYGTLSTVLGARMSQNTGELLQRAGWKGTNSPFPFSDWCWVPHNCSYAMYSTEDFCEKLHGRNILIVGDSLQHQLYEALHMQLGIMGTSCDEYGSPYLCSGYMCPGASGGWLHYVRNDQIRVDNNEPLLRFNANQHPFFQNWTQIAADFDIIVLNKGAHYVQSEDHFLDETQRTAEFVKRNYVEYRKEKGFRNAHVIYRTTAAGHPHGSIFSQVNTSMIFPSDPLTVDCGDIGSDEQYTYCYCYGWDRFMARDKLAVDIFRKSLGSSITIMNIAPMTHLRPDGHRCEDVKCGDRLHYFLPSVVDSWVHMLFNLMPSANRV